MFDMQFNTSELESINNFKKLMHYDELLAIFKEGALDKNCFSDLYNYLCDLKELVEFKPSWSLRDGVFKFNDDMRLITIDAFDDLYNKIHKYYKGIRLDVDSDLNRFFIESRNTIASNDDRQKLVFVDLDGCYGYKLKADAHPELISKDRYLESRVIETIFRKCFKYDDQNEWSRVACECMLRSEINIKDAQLEDRLKKLTEYRRYGVDIDDSHILIVYDEMLEKRKDKNGVDYWRVSLPNYDDAEKAWFNVKRDAIGDIAKNNYGDVANGYNDGVVEIYLHKGAAYNIHYIKKGKHLTKWSNVDKVILPILKPISDGYIKWLEDAKMPTFSKKLLALGINDDTKDDFAIALNGGKQFVAICIDDGIVHGYSYNSNYEYTGSNETEIGDYGLGQSLNIVFNYLSDTDAKDTEIGLCDYGRFVSNVENNKARSDMKIIGELDDMLTEENDRRDLAKLMKKKYP